jgi:ribosomal protein L40E
LFLTLLFHLGWKSFPQPLHFISLTLLGSSRESLLSISALISESSSFSKAVSNTRTKALFDFPSPNFTGKTQTKVYCSPCGTENSAEATFCVKCGKKIANQRQSTNSDKSDEKDAEDKEADMFFNAGKDEDLIFPEDGI